MAVLGIDIGASKIYFAALQDEKLINEGFYPNTPPDLEGLTTGLKETQRTLQRQKISVERIGVAVPGNPKGGTLAAARNFPALVGFPLVKKVKNIFGIAPADLVNDAFAFAFAETKLGAGEGFKRVAGITLGSGLGSGFVVDGKLYQKDNWSAIRQAILNVRDGLDAEDLCSEKFFKNQGLDVKKSAKQAKKGDAESKRIWQEFGKNVGEFLSGVGKILDPQVIILGGGIANDFPLFAKEVKQEVKVPVFKTTLGPAAGAIGAALLAG